jgi:hypothetical protein
LHFDSAYPSNHVFCTFALEIKKMKFISIGDVHGRDTWKNIVYKNGDINNCLVGKSIDNLQSENDLIYKLSDALSKSQIV